MSIHIGDKAPDFSLYSSEKQLVHLSDFKGRNVVLLFFPLAFTSTCTKELCSTRDEMEVYNALDTEVLGISIDTPQSLARYKQDHQFNFTLLSDFNKDTIKAYDAIYEQFGHNMKGVGKRAAFVIDGEGIVRYAEVLEDAGKIPDFDAIQNALRNFQTA
ncbi:MAG: redoxin domain-containing protein [Saprospiraceae bacterium]|nr:redoxin domain-containing protein [Candidatus Opimibacter skivensis]